VAPNKKRKAAEPPSAQEDYDYEISLSSASMSMGGISVPLRAAPAEAASHQGTGEAGRRGAGRCHR